MNKKFTTIILSIILIVLVFGSILFGKAIYDDIVGENLNNTIYKVGNIATEEPEPNGSSTISQENTNKITSVLTSGNTANSQNTTANNSENTINKYFYSQLVGNEKIIYDKILESKENLKQGNYKIEFETDFKDTLSSEDGGEKLGQDYQTAIEAFMHDNPELFYIDVNKMYLNIETTTKFLKTSYKVYIDPAKDQTYFNSDFSDKSQVEIAINQIESVKNDIIGNLKGNDYDKIMKIHDYLVDNIEYDSTYKARGTYSIYGALIGKSCVCEGYAKALKYLANQAGIMCEIMQGTATNSAGQTESHAWNCVKIDEKWYQIDTTWDDPVFVGTGYKVNVYKYKYFLRGTNTFEKDHILSYQFSDNGKVFEYPTISTRDY